MSSLSIITEIKGLADKIKKSQQSVKEQNSANRALINKLLQMESAYGKNSSEKMPNYNKIVPEIQKQTIPKLKTQEELKQQASAYIDELVEQNRKKVENKASDKINTLTLKQDKAIEKHKKNLEQAAMDLEHTEEKIKERTIKQGLTNSSIFDSWQTESHNEFNDIVASIETEYNKYVEQLSNEIALINTAKEQSLADYNLKLAAEYEKKLQTLKEEQIKAIDNLTSLNSHYEKERQKRQERIAQLENVWLKEQQEKQQKQQQKEIQEGYTGEKALEMEKRYNEALSFYKSLEKNKALKYIEENSDQLKKALGLYYKRLMDEIRK